MRLSLIIPTRRGSEALERCVAAIEKHTTDYELVIVEGEKGFNEKLNEGIKQAKGDYLVFLHDDAEVTKGWSDKLSDCGSFCLGENNDDFDTWGGFYNPHRYCTDPTETPEYSYWLCLSQKVAKDIYPLDERFTDPMCQDVDLGYHLKSKGYTIECLPGKIIHRCGEGSGAENGRQRGYVERKWRLYAH